MDPVIVSALPEIIGPTVAVVVLSAIPVLLVYMSKHFKLRTRELELEAELHGRHSQARLQAMETRLSALEGALTSLVQTISRRQDLMQPPDAPQLTQEASRTPALAQVKKSRID